jgi:hypothetical protein
VLAEALRATLQTPDVQEKLAHLQYDPVYLSGEALHERIGRLSDEVARVKPRKPVGLPNVPLLIGAAVAAVAVVVSVQTFRTHTLTSSSVVLRRIGLKQHAQFFAVVLCLAIYVGVLTAEVVSFAPATFVFVTVVSTVLAEINLKHFATGLLLATSLSYGVERLLSRFFQVMLP